MSKKVAFHNLGCKVNSYELEFVQQRFTENDFRIVPFDQKADIYVVNTCTVTNIADRKSRQMLHRAKTLNPDAIVVAMGCYVETSKDEARKDLGIDVLIGNSDKGHAYEKIVEFLNNKDSNNTEDKHLLVNDINETKEYDEFKLSFTTEHTRVHVKIQDGCNQFCSYCAIPLARGRVRSRKIEDIVSEIEGLCKNNYKEFVLTGIHLSSYGMENYNIEMSNENPVGYSEYENAKLIDAIEAVAKIKGVKRIRLGSLEPRIITEDFLKRLVATGKICPHFHLSLQSGSDSVLKRMNRRYSTDEFLEKTKLIREYFIHAGITTDVIAGFPGETNEEFTETKEYMNKVDFYEAHIFKYSRRRGTLADKMDNQLTDKEKSVRSEILIKDANERSRKFREYYIGKRAEVLFEEIIVIGGEDYLTGYTREYVKVALKSGDEKLINEIRDVRIEGFINDEVMSAILCKDEVMNAGL
ncbi:MAG: tRNA (N(6)-L-threonylcarbamoyladenosine(37)-C(2))-methylthiotransferase MtaB [Lachnospiraceae bacterium]|nr:tRNA (N(6)-L-threonylcarbamoyladenosine(37)-C(2))-methylthiotransferase MtaB [Lachnospiraceae bacterium]